MILKYQIIVGYRYISYIVDCAYHINMIMRLYADCRCIGYRDFCCNNSVRNQWCIRVNRNYRWRMCLRPDVDENISVGTCNRYLLYTYMHVAGKTRRTHCFFFYYYFSRSLRTREIRRKNINKYKLQYNLLFYILYVYYMLTNFC